MFQWPPSSSPSTARVMEDNPIALRLKELETLEKVTEKIDKILVFDGLDAVQKDLVKIRRGQIQLDRPKAIPSTLCFRRPCKIHIRHVQPAGKSKASPHQCWNRTLRGGNTFSSGPSGSTSG